jgi:hypothetical protein
VKALDTELDLVLELWTYKIRRWALRTELSYCIYDSFLCLAEYCRMLPCTRLKGMRVLKDF